MSQSHHITSESHALASLTPYSPRPCFPRCRTSQLFTSSAWYTFRPWAHHSTNSTQSPAWTLSPSTYHPANTFSPAVLDALWVARSSSQSSQWGSSGRGFIRCWTHQQNRVYPPFVMQSQAVTCMRFIDWTSCSGHLQQPSLWLSS